MAKAKPKTTENNKSVSAFIKSVPDAAKQKDCMALIDILEQQSGFEPKMWGPAIVGFGSYHYVYESGHEGDAPYIGLSPRKAAIVLYIPNYDGKEEMLKKLGKHKTTKGCTYVKKLEDIDIAVLKKMVKPAIQYYKNKFKSVNK